MTDTVAVDRERIQAVCGGDEALAIELIGMLVDEATPLLEQLTAAIESGDIKQVHEIAHSLKGIAGNVGAAELRGAAERLQTATEHDAAPAPAQMNDDLRAIAAALERVRVKHTEWTSNGSAASIFA